MARGDRDGGGTKGRVKFRVIEFELDGGDTALLESLRSIAATFGGRLKVAPVKMLPSPASGAAQTEPEVDPESDDAASVGAASENPPDRPVRTLRTFKSPNVITDLDLESGVPLKSFCEGKKPDGDWKRYLVICAWLKEQRGIDDVGIDHIYTCYRAMGWHPRKDVAQPLREMKSKQGWFAKGKQRGTYAINHIGLAEVAKS